MKPFHFHTSYAVSYAEIMEKWIGDFHSIDHVIVIYDPNNHIDFLKQNEISLDEMHMYSSKVLVLSVLSINDLIAVHKKLSSENGPYVQAWSSGALIRESY